MENNEFIEVVKNVPLDFKLQQLDDIITHKTFVLKAGHKLIKKLFEHGEDADALDLLDKIMYHDNTKALSIEFGFMAKSADENESLKSPQAGIDVSKSKMKAIKQHWKTNAHHPEHWMTIMPDSLYQEHPIKVSMCNKIFIMEMCCDWYARSLQFNTNVMDFWHEHSKKRWTFDITTSALIEKYLKMLVED
jgi:ribosomal protein L28